MARDRYDDDYDDDYDRPRGRTRDRYDDDYDDDYDDRPRGAPPPNYLVPAIFITLCCCTIGGIISIVYAAQVNSKWAQGDYAGARAASASAKMWCILSFCIGAITTPALIAFQIWAEQQAGR